MDRKEEILEIAFRLFAEKGYQVSMSDIAEKVGIKTPSLYSHFKNKDEIIFLMIEKLVGELFDLMRRTLEASKDSGCGEALKNVFFTSIKFNDYDRLRVYRRLPFIEKEDLRNRCIGIMREKETDFIQSLIQVIQTGIQNGEILEVADNGIIMLFMSMLQGNLDGKLLYKGFTNVDEFVEKSWACFWNGIRKRTKSDCECFNK
jgi:AcrR family transcriptional regulator